MLDSIIRSRQIAIVIVMVFMAIAYVGYYALLFSFEKKAEKAYLRGIEYAMALETKQHSR